MRFTISGRKINVTEEMRNIIEKKLSKLSKFFDDDATAQITLSADKKRQTVESTIYSKGIIYRAEETNDDIYAAIDKSVDIIERQIRKNKTRLEKHLKGDSIRNFALLDDVSDEETPEFNIVKTKRHIIKPMSPEEAILQMNLIGHSFYIFKNAKNDEMCVVYKRKDGDYGIISMAE